MGDEIPPLVKDLAEGVSSAVEVQNRYWLALAVAALFTLTPEVGGKQPDQISLPFGLPAVDAAWFALLSLLLLSALIIAFAASHAHLLRSLRFAHRILQRRSRGRATIEGEDERDLFQALIKPSLSHVSSIAQVVRGPDIFFSNKKESRTWRLRTSVVLYAAFKVLVVLVWLVAPAGVLLVALVRYLRLGAPAPISWLSPLAVWPLATVAAFSICVAIFLELHYLATVFRRLWAESE